MEEPLKNLDDAYKWSLETVEALRAGDFSRIDMDELINEIGSIAGGLRRELVFLLKDVLESLWIQEYGCGDEADRQLVHAQAQLQLLLHSSPPLVEALQEASAKAYQRARDSLSRECAELALPDRCPFPMDRITEDPYDRLVAEGRFD